MLKNFEKKSKKEEKFHVDVRWTIESLGLLFTNSVVEAKCIWRTSDVCGEGILPVEASTRFHVGSC